MLPAPSPQRLVENLKGSGYGRDLSVYALDDYSRTKHVMHNHER